LWDVHTRVGGTAGTELQSAQCASDPSAKDVDWNCIGAFMLMHVTSTVVGLMLENNWFWVADCKFVSSFFPLSFVPYTPSSILKANKLVQTNLTLPTIRPLQYTAVAVSSLNLQPVLYGYTEPPRSIILFININSSTQRTFLWVLFKPRLRIIKAIHLPQNHSTLTPRTVIQTMLHCVKVKVSPLVRRHMRFELFRQVI